MSTSPMGTIALIGAGEYLPAIATLDQQLLERVSGTPQVVVLPTASVPDGPNITERWILMGIDHFTRLGATVEPIRLFTRADADDATIGGHALRAQIGRRWRSGHAYRRRAPSSGER